MTPPRAATGFTIVELMVALFIFAMLAASGVMLLAFGVRAQAAASSKLDSVAAEQRLSALIASDLMQAVPRVTRDSDGRSIRAFTGNDGRSDPLVMAYVRGGWSNPDSAARSTLQRVDVALAGGRLERRSYAMTDGAVAATTTVLADRVTSLAMRYRDRKGVWRERWDDPIASSSPVALEAVIARQAQPPLRLVWLVGTEAR